MVSAVFRKPTKRESGSCRVIWTEAMGQRSISGPYYTTVPYSSHASNGFNFLATLKRLLSLSLYFYTFCVADDDWRGADIEKNVTF